MGKDYFNYNDFDTAPEATEPAAPEEKQGGNVQDDSDQEESQVDLKPDLSKVEKPAKTAPQQDIKTARQAAKASQIESDKIAKKILKAKLNGTEIDLDPEVEIPVTVRGKQEFLKLQDAINRSSGDIDIERKYNDFNKTKQKYDNEIKRFKEAEESWNEFSKAMLSKVKSEKPEDKLDAFNNLVERMGADPIMFTNELVKALMPMVERYSAMSPEERALYDANLKLQAADAREQKRLQREAEAKEQSAHQAYLKNVEAEVVDGLERFAVSQDEFAACYARAKQIKEEGFIKGEILPAHVFGIAVEDRARSMFQSKIAEIAPGLDDAKKSAFEEYVVDMVLQDPFHPPEFFEGIVREALGVAVAQPLSEKVGNAPQKTPKSKEREFKYSKNWTHI